MNVAMVNHIMVKSVLRTRKGIHFVRRNIDITDFLVVMLYTDGQQLRPCFNKLSIQQLNVTFDNQMFLIK